MSKLTLTLTDSSKSSKSSKSENSENNVNIMGVSMQFLLDFSARREVNELRTEEVCDQFVFSETSNYKISYSDYILECLSDFNNVDEIYIAPATVFVSHAWKYNFIEMVEALRSWWVDNGCDSKVYFWIDLFVNNQHTTKNSFDWLETTFRSSVASIGHMLVVLLPWDSPIYTQRAWCLYEFYAGVISNSNMEILLSPKQKNEFKVAIRSEHFLDSCLPSFFHIDFEKADASLKSDKDAIMKIVKKQVSIYRLNSIVMKKLKEWLFREVAKVWEETDLSDYVSRRNMTEVYTFYGEIEAVLNKTKQLLEKQIKVLGYDNLATLWTLRTISVNSNLAFQLIEADKYHKELKIHLKNYSTNHPEKIEATFLTNIMRIDRSVWHSIMGRPNWAYKRVDSMFKASLICNFKGMTNMEKHTYIMGFVGCCSLGAIVTEEMFDICSLLCQMVVKSFGEHYVISLFVKSMFGVVLAHVDRQTDAVNSLEDSLLWTKILFAVEEDKWNTSIAFTSMHLAEVYENLGQYEEALRLLNYIIDNAPESTGAGFSVICHLHKGSILNKLERYIEAEAHFRMGLRLKSVMTGGKMSTEMNYYSQRVVVGFVNVLTNRKLYVEANIVKMFISQTCFVTGQSTPKGLWSSQKENLKSKVLSFDSVYGDSTYNTMPPLPPSPHNSSKSRKEKAKPLGGSRKEIGLSK